MTEDYTKISVDLPRAVKAELQLRGRRQGGLKVSPYVCQLICKALALEMFEETYRANGYMGTKLKLTKPLGSKDVEQMAQDMTQYSRQSDTRPEAVS